MKKTITLIRHPESIANTYKVIANRDVPLSDYGKKSAEMFAQQMNGTFDNHIIYSSPAERCMDLALLLCKTWPSPRTYITDPLLEERHFGKFVDSTQQDIMKTLHHTYPAYQDDTFTELLERRLYDTNLDPYFESTPDFKQRLQSWITKEQRNLTHPDHSITVVTHSGVIRALTSLWTGQTVAELESQLPDGHLPHLSQTVFQVDTSTGEIQLLQLAYIADELKDLLMRI